ncbi:MAG: sugar O-acetyltransferase [Oscillospiraceae bacterium]|nr:sugar O-acetyltransferase [Oscillospiraceae bacterium]
MTELEKNMQLLHTGDLYVCNSPEMFRLQMEYRSLIQQYNQMDPRDMDGHAALLPRIFAEVGEGCFIEPPFNANWGCFTHLGRNVYANFNLTLTDDTHIYIGDDVMIGPNVTITAATHPLHPALRRKGLQYTKPVTLGAGAWIGAGSIILPGVTIGENAVIGAGSIVTKDIPAGVLAVGSPCRVVRPIGEEDRLAYDHGRPVPPEFL